jgi:4-cresol dehydrogenase (hydroxylating)
MELALPSGLSNRQFNAALRDFAGVVGEPWVLATDEDRDAYLDVFAWDAAAHAPSAAVAPSTAEEVQAVIRVANARDVPLWVISRGKNFGYGGASPVLKGSVVLDLSRMKGIEIDEEFGTALLEPGVGFYDLYDHIESRGLPLWLSVPGNSWGSVVGNALDRGVGYTSYGDHPARICGLEVVLPDGELVRTGPGAMAGSKTWQLQRGGFGPGWDHMFLQSNFGVVTKMGLWLMPEPEAVLGLNIELESKEDLGWAVDIVAKYRREGLIQAAPSFGNWLRVAATLTRRSEWTDQPGALADSVIDAIRARYNLGWWSLSLRFFGYEDVNLPIQRRLEAEFGAHALHAMVKADWRRGQPRNDSFAGTPITFPLQNANWHGGRGGHIGYSPTLPARGDLAMAQFRRTYDRYVEFGMDYHGSFAMGERHITNVNQLLFNKDDADMVGRVEGMFHALVEDATAQGYGEYRAHIAFMDLVASTYGFNDYAARRLNERVKDALDPKGILAPGKSGIWPRKYRGGGR